jgi:hypothetical protein
MHLPNAASATLDVRKLTQYCLDRSHPLGRHKARVFEAAFALTADDSDWLRNEILRGIVGADAEELESDRFGTRYRIDLMVRRQGREGVVRTVWIVPGANEAPRFVTCWVL